MAFVSNSAARPLLPQQTLALLKPGIDRQLLNPALIERESTGINFKLHTCYIQQRQRPASHETLNTCEPNPKHSAPSPAEDGPATGAEERIMAACHLPLKQPPIPYISPNPKCSPDSDPGIRNPKNLLKKSLHP